MIISVNESRCSLSTQRYLPSTLCFQFTYLKTSSRSLSHSSINTILMGFKIFCYLNLQCGFIIDIFRKISALNLSTVHCNTAMNSLKKGTGTWRTNETIKLLKKCASHKTRKWKERTLKKGDRSNKVNRRLKIINLLK